VSQETAGWFVTQGALGVGCVLLIAAVVWLSKWLRDLYQDRLREIGVLRDALNESSTALEKVTDGMIAIRGSVADAITIAGACKVLAEDIQREARAIPLEINRETARVVEKLDDIQREVRAALDHRRGRS